MLKMMESENYEKLEPLKWREVGVGLSVEVKLSHTHIKTYLRMLSPIVGHFRRCFLISVLKSKKRLGFWYPKALHLVGGFL